MPSNFGKIVWSEGLFLRPQHFQQQDRHLERYAELHAQALRPHAWGFTELELERDLLAVGKLGLRRARGVFPDGTPFAMPDDDPLPAPLDLDGASRGQRVQLAVPLRNPGGLEIARNARPDGLARYQVNDHEVRDVTSPTDAPATLEVGALRSRLLLDSEPAEGYARIPVAHVIERRADGQVLLDDRHVPTVARCAAAPGLATFLLELQGLLHQRGEALAARATASGRAGSAEIADFLLLQSVNRYEPVVAHHAAAPLLHPEDLYRLLVEIAGDLATLTSTARRPPPFPPYRHDDLRATFEPPIAALRAALSAVLEQTAVPIPLESKGYGVNVGTIADRGLLDGAVFVLAVRADAPAEELRRLFPGYAKLGPVEKIRDLVNLQLPGIPLAPLPVAPRQIPYHAGFVYYELERTGELWRALRTSGGFAIHVPERQFPSLALELWAIRG